MVSPRCFQVLKGSNGLAFFIAMIATLVKTSMRTVKRVEKNLDSVDPAIYATSQAV